MTKIRLHKDGIDDYYWPVEREFVLEPLEQIFPIILNAAQKEESLHASLPVLAKWLLLEPLKMIEATILDHELQKKSFFFPEEHYHFLRAYKNDTLNNEAYKAARGLARAQPKGINLPVGIKTKIRDIQRNGFFKTLYHHKNDNFLTFYPHALARSHAKNKNIFLQHEHLSQWFGDIQPDLVANTNLPKSTNALIQDMNAVIDSILKNRGLSLPPQMAQYLETFTRQMLAVTILRVQEIENKISGQKLWIGSSGAGYFIKLLAHTARRNKGYVIAHDHGHSNAQVDLCLSSHVVEYGSCDEFITYTDHIAKIKNQEINEDWLFAMPKPKISGLYPSHATSDKIFKAPAIKTLMYTATAYHSERARLRPIPSDVSYFDYQMKLFNCLKQQGIRVLYKPHPEGQFSPQKEFAAHFNVELIEKPFEQVKENVDGYLIDFVASSTTAPIFASNKPVIFIDLGYPKLTNEAETLLEQRCTLIKADIDNHNRINVNWENVSEALQRKEHQFNKNFPDLYYGDSI